MARDLYMSDERYLKALKRIRQQIAEGPELSYYDDTTIGNKDTSATWGLCSSFAEQWPDAEDHLWSDQFRDGGRVAPKYRVRGQSCPFDDPEDGYARMDNLEDPRGCFWRCRVFQAGHRGFIGPPSREEALELYDLAIERARTRMEVADEDGDAYVHG